MVKIYFKNQHFNLKNYKIAIALNILSITQMIILTSQKEKGYYSSAEIMYIENHIDLFSFFLISVYQA